jgi:hypothetical protein
MYLLVKLLVLVLLLRLVVLNLLLRLVSCVLYSLGTVFGRLEACGGGVPRGLIYILLLVTVSMHSYARQKTAHTLLDNLLRISLGLGTV